MRTGTVKFSMSQKVTDSLQTKKQEKTFLFTLQESTEELREGDRVSYEEEEGRKGKVAAKVAVIIFFFYLRMFKRFEFFGTFFFVLN
jgi:CspA family cold shock protein